MIQNRGLTNQDIRDKIIKNTTARDKIKKPNRVFRTAANVAEEYYPSLKEVERVDKK